MKIRDLHRLSFVTVGLLLTGYTAAVVLHPPENAQWTATLVPYVTAGILMSTFFVNWRTTIEMKVIDLLIHFGKLYEQIAFAEWSELANSPTPQSRQRVEQHFRRFWNLQLEQFLFYKRGLIDRETYQYWMNCRFEENKANESVPWKDKKGSGSMSFREGWEYARSHYIRDNTFVGFMNQVFIDPSKAFH